jgi:decaprenylphospho-beta-D-erythro-pentofuranosid-2-ulose 2-reductase
MVHKRIVIVGATSAIAAETACLFAGDGAVFFLVGRNEAKLERLAVRLHGLGAGAITTRVLDLEDLPGHRTLPSEALKAMDGIDVLLIAHGLFMTDRDMDDLDFAAAEKIINVNFLSVVSLLSAFVPYFERTRAGRIAVISSIAGDRGKCRNLVYASAKGGLSIYLQGLRNRLHFKGVSVTTVKPGTVDTPMTAHLPKGGLVVEPQRVARGIYRAILKGKDEVYLPWFWWPIMKIVKASPEMIFKRLKT